MNSVIDDLLRFAPRTARIHDLTVSPSLPFRRRHDEEPRALHAAMTAASAGDRAKVAAAFAALAEAMVWIAAADGLEGGVERVIARARLSGFASLGVRVGRLPDGTPFVAAATTAARLEASRLTEPGDMLTTMPLTALARIALANGLETVVVNPGTVPMVHLTAGALRSIADGVLPSGGDPDGAAMARPDQVRVRQVPVPDDLASAIAEVLSAEPVMSAAIVPAEVGGSPAWVCLVTGPVPAALKDRLIAVALPLIGGEAYFTVSSVDATHAWPSWVRIVIDRR